MAAQTQRFLNSRARLVVFAVMLTAAVYLLAVTPARTFLDQRRQMAVAEQRVSKIEEANKALTQRTIELQSDAEIARLAREKYELVPKGTDAYAVMPPPSSSTAAPSKAKKDNGLWSRIKDGVTFWN